MGRMVRVVAAIALAVIAGCSSTVPGQVQPGGVAPGSGTPSATGGPRGSAASVGDLCATVSPAELARAGLAGATARSIGGPLPSCQWKKPGEFVPVVLMLAPGEDLDVTAEAMGRSGPFQDTEVAGMRGLERGSAESCTVLVEHSAGVLGTVAPESCEQGRRILAAAVSGLAS